MANSWYLVLLGLPTPSSWLLLWLLWVMVLVRRTEAWCLLHGWDAPWRGQKPVVLCGRTRSAMPTPCAVLASGGILGAAPNGAPVFKALNGLRQPIYQIYQLSQRLPVSSTAASPKEVKLLKYTFGLYFVKYPGTRWKVEHLVVFRKRQTYFMSGFVF